MHKVSCLEPDLGLPTSNVTTPTSKNRDELLITRRTWSRDVIDEGHARSARGISPNMSALQSEGRSACFQALVDLYRDNPEPSSEEARKCAKNCLQLETKYEKISFSDIIRQNYVSRHLRPSM